MANFVEKENIWLRIAKYLFPWKGDKPTEIIRKILFLGAAVVLAVSVVSLIISGTQKIDDTKNNEQLSELFHGTNTGSTTLNIDTSRTEEIKKENPEVLDEFLPLLEINEDVVGWITLGDEEKPLIDYVVVQGEDNDFYLNHNYKKEESISGAVFMDYSEPLTAEKQPANIILYGHNMQSGEYFAKLTRYFNYRPSNNYGMDFYKQYPTLTFSTLYKKSTYKIFAGMLVNTQESEGEVFRYIDNLNFGSKSEFDNFCADVLDRSTFFTDVDLKYGDQLLTMSTCIFDYNTTRNLNLRWVLFAREVREGEDPAVDVEKAYPNPDPLYFDYYYRIYGGEWGGRKWDASMIQGFSY